MPCFTSILGCASHLRLQGLKSANSWQEITDSCYPTTDNGPGTGRNKFREQVHQCVYAKNTGRQVCF